MVSFFERLSRSMKCAVVLAECVGERVGSGGLWRIKIRKSKHEGEANRKRFIERLHNLTKLYSLGVSRRS